MNEMVVCPHCSRLGAPTPEGNCAFCGKPLASGAPWADSEAAGQAAMLREFQIALHRATPRVLVTPAIVAVNVLVFVAMVASGVSLVAPSPQDVLPWGANFGPLTLGGEWWRLLTSMFLHYGIIHLAFNMWVLWDVGKLVERLVGNVGFLLMYLFSGVMGSLASLAWHPVAVGAGASGAVFGVIGALAGFLALRRDSVPPHVLRSLRSSLGAFLFYNLVLGLAVPAIDLSAHAGGFAAGAVCGLIMSRPLTRATTGGRALRNLAVLALAAAAAPGAMALLPPPPPDLDTHFADFEQTEARLLDQFDATLTRLDEGRLSKTAAADELETHVLRPWSKLRQHMETVADAPNINHAAFSKLMTSLRLREESFGLLIAFLRTDDEAKHRQHLEKWQAAERLLEELDKSQ